MIETERLILRKFVAEDAQELFELDADPEVRKFLGAGTVNSLKEAEAVVQHIQKQYKENGLGRWAIIDKATNDFVGWSGLKYEKEVRKDFNYYDLGYRLKRNYWGKGIATETAIKSLEYGFNRLELKEVCAAAHIENAASNKILKNLGFELKETFTLDGAAHNWHQLHSVSWLANQHLK